MPDVAECPIVATFNLHAGVDGWCRPYDVLGACRSLDADLLVLQESWTPEGGQSLAATIGRELGYEVVEHTIGRGRLGSENPRADDRWGPGNYSSPEDVSLFLEGPRPLPPALAHAPRYLDGSPGSFDIAVLSRLPVVGHRVLDLGQQRRDPTRRAALAVTVDLGAREVTVVGTHMAHLTRGSPTVLRRLAAALRARDITRRAVLAGDMNLWGPPLSLFFPTWHRAVRGRTWPAWRPHSQLDHVLVTPDVRCDGGHVGEYLGSDHRPVLVRLVPERAAGPERAGPASAPIR